MLRGHRVLVVEDEPLIAHDLQCGLEIAEAGVIGPAYALRQALELAVMDGITAAIVDIRLQDKHAGSLIELLMRRRVPIIIYSASNLDEAARRWPSATIVEKPAPVARIIETLAELHIAG